MVATVNVNETLINQPIAPKPKWRKILRISLISLGISLSVVLLAAILVPLLFEKQIKNLFISELNKSLATAVTINQDDIHLSLLKNFPNASVVFNNMGIKESFAKSNKHFLEAEEISLVFNVWDIFRGNYNIKHIKVKNGFCHLITDKKGNVNYKFWKDAEGESEANFSINLEEVDCENIDFQYLDYKYQQHIELLVHNCSLNGNFSSNQYTLAVIGDVLSKRIKIGNTAYLINKESHVDTKINVDVPNENYAFEDGEITIDNNTFIMNGNIALLGEDYYDLAITGDKISLEGLMLLLPGNISNNLSKYQSKGKIDFSTTIKGIYTSAKTPAITIAFNVQNGSIQHEQFGGKLDNMNFSGKYSNGEKHSAATSFITVNNFSATQNNLPVTLELDYKNFINPYIDLHLDGTFPASLIIPMAMNNAEDVQGVISLNNIDIKGNIKNLSTEFSTAQPAGTISLQDVAFVINNQTVSIPSGVAKVLNNEVTLNGLAINIAGSDLNANIVINNWIQQVFPSEFKPALNINGSIRAENINLSELIAVFESEPNDAVNKKVNPEVPTAPASASGNYNFSGNIDLVCNNFSYDKVLFSNITAAIKLTPGLIIVNDLQGGAMAGKFNVDATFREMPNGDVVLQTSGMLEKIEVAQLFEQFGNFGQTTLTATNLKGRISANIYEMNIRFDKDFILDESYLYILCDMKIENGELIDYKPLESLSSFVKISDLRHIKFSTLENKIEIKNRLVILPAMQIKSTAVDMYISGTHSFDDEIDYQFKLSMADVMVRKFLGGNKQKDNYEEDTEGGVNVYISMTGTVNEPIIKYNKKEAKQKLQDSGMEENRFLDIFKPDPSEEMFKQNDKQSKKQPVKTDDAIEFIEFEEE